MKRNWPVGAVGLSVLLMVVVYHFHLYERLFFPERFYFASVRGTQFYLQGEPFRFLGANTRLVHGADQRGQLTEALDAASRHGVRVVRQWVVGECVDDSTAIHRPIDQYYFQAGPNQWVEPSFVFLDSLMAAAGQRGLKISLTLFNNWSDYGGMPMYLRWAEVQGQSQDELKHDAFYTDPQIRAWARAFIHKLATRRNTVTGQLYRDDPTLFSWELVNEMEVDFDNVAALHDWVREMAGYLKELDPHHLVGSSFSLYERRLVRDYIVSTSSLPQLDYVDVHFYPTAHHQRFLLAGEQAFEQVIDDLVQVAHQVVDKPLVIGEVGFPRNKMWQGQPREYWFERFFQHVLAVGVDGVMVWSYGDPSWRDELTINWRDPVHAQVCSLMSRYGEAFKWEGGPRLERPHIGPELGDSLRVAIPVQELDAEIHKPVNTGAALEYAIPVDAYARAHWINMGYWAGSPGFASAYGKDWGFFEYAFQTARPETLSQVQLSLRLSTDFPPLAGADSLGRSDLTVRLDGRVLGGLHIIPQPYFGTVYTLDVGRDRGAPLWVLPPGRHALQLAVEEQAAHQNGLAVMGPANQEEYQADELSVRLRLIRD
ncbi:MAG: hypothetical protein GKR89_33015 [Candidatus Latescibacteria bacterium]|nr:hypothetical protein [Candidatus Latescibacterota bacterium]